MTNVAGHKASQVLPLMKLVHLPKQKSLLPVLEVLSLFNIGVSMPFHGLGFTGHCTNLPKGPVV